ncbi:uncharacterized protein FPRO_08401 [Fusarium proliferatum ET1]|uniref:Uncharacterized protein n=1 Tax=Fusarium proliferatum (strain ET1) TaxID=1227346 RepID=A0A1L7W307_FUSPR|nr:uncharacterized protein FPRO_08401 [Fusarium proliferatum ET1]CZR47027.1 uncharacterized protein FPRO_08401 [Fusarium proliferatum ET1]
MASRLKLSTLCNIANRKVCPKKQSIDARTWPVEGFGHMTHRPLASREVTVGRETTLGVRVIARIRFKVPICRPAGRAQTNAERQILECDDRSGSFGCNRAEAKLKLYCNYLVKTSAVEPKSPTFYLC